MMKKWLLALLFISFEVIIIFTFNWTVRDYLTDTITGDGQGYYDYLPSVFIHKDINRHNNGENERDKFQERATKHDFYLKYDEQYVNRYPCGTAILQTPFFLAAWYLSRQDGTVADGYGENFQYGIYYAALFYLFLSLLFLKKLLKLYDIRWWIIYILQIFIVFATPVTQYASLNAAFSHVYSLFAVTALLYFAKKYFDTRNISAFLWAALFMGLVIIIRNINLVVILFIPFLAGSRDKLKDGILLLFQKPLHFISGLVIMCAVVFIQLLLWYLQTGHFLLYSYQGDGFNFLDPQFINILFSYQKGLFIYTPVLLFGIIGIIRMFWKKNFYQAVTWLLFFVFLTYLLSSWEWWYYGRSFGLRAYIDFFAIFFIPFALLLQEIKWPVKVIIILIATLTIPLNLIQNYQYIKYIIHGTGMNKERYWQVFLKTHDCYKGIFYKPGIEEDQYLPVLEDSISSIQVEPNTNEQIWSFETSDLNDFSKVSVIQVSFENDFSEGNYDRLLLNIKDDSKVSVYHRPYFIQFTNGHFNTYQTGIYNYMLPKIEAPEKQLVELIVMADGDGAELKNLKVRFLEKK